MFGLGTFRELLALRELLARRSLEDRVVVLTGATGGIGRAVALRLARRGATVVAVARDPAALKELTGEADGIVDHPADITVAADRDTLISGTLAQQGRIDVLVNNVGIGWSGLVEEMTGEQVRTLVETNVIASIELARLALPAMLARGEGDLLFTVSGASWFSAPPLRVYAATKYALEGFAEGLRREVLARGVRVHAIYPGLVATQFAARSAGQVPGEVHGPPRRGPGMPPSRVAAAIERALTRPGVHAVAVPRLLGATRVVKLPPLRQAADLLVAVNAERLARIGVAVARRSAGSSIGRGPPASHPRSGSCPGTPASDARIR